MDGGIAQDPRGVPGLISFWDFQEDAGEDRAASGSHAYRLREGVGPVRRVADGVCGPYAAFIDFGQWLRAPRADCPALDIHGRRGVTVVAWVKRLRKPNQHDWGEFIAGIWDEHGKRQYALFLNLGQDSVRPDNAGLDDTGYGHQVNGHVSDTGGPTPGFEWNRNASFSAATVPFDRWSCAAMSYDGASVRSYANGACDPRPRLNPFAFDGGLHDGGPDGADFYVGGDPVPGYGIADCYHGLLGGLAVYDHALGDDQLATLAGLGR